MCDPDSWPPHEGVFRRFRALSGSVLVLVLVFQNARIIAILQPKTTGLEPQNFEHEDEHEHEDELGPHRMRSAAFMLTFVVCKQWVSACLLFLRSEDSSLEQA
jgi:hypothetical protein